MEEMMNVEREKERKWDDECRKRERLHICSISKQLTTTSSQ